MKRWVHFKLLLILLPLYACAEPLSDKSLSLELYPDTIIQRFYKQSLKVGVYRPDYPPFDIVINGEYLDGINADILRTIRNNSDIHFSVTLFDNAVAAFDALAEGSIDAITTTGPVTETKKSRYSYLPVISTNKIVEIAPAENKLDTRDYETIAIVDRFISDEFIKERYPEAKINRYDSVLNALASVALHKNDIYVGDAISAGYFYNNSVFNTLHVSRQLNTINQAEGKVYFAIRNSDIKTRQIIESGLQKISQSDLSEFIRGWDKSSDFITPGSPQYLTEKEARWLQGKKQFYVQLPTTAPPFSEYANGTFTGIIPDVFSLIGKMLNVTFAFLPENPSSKNINPVEIVGFASSVYNTDTRYRFTRSFIQFPLVFVTRHGESLKKVPTRARRIATFMDVNHLEGYDLTSHTVVPVSSTAAAYDLLGSNKVDAVLDNFVSANYYTHTHQYSLAIDDIVDGNFAKLSLGISAHNEILYEIINKSLKNLAGSELDDITTKWTAAPSKTSFIEANKTAILYTVIVLLLLGMISTGWALVLRKHVRHAQRTQRKLDDQLALTNALINGTPNPLYVRNKDAELISFNEAYTEALKDFHIEQEYAFSQAEFENTTASHLSSLETYRQDFFSVLRDKVSISKDRAITFSDGRPDAVIYHWMVPFLDAEGRVNGVIGGWIDITSRIEMEESLRAARKESERANVAKSTFLATMSHEIRTPLNAIIGMLELGTKKLHDGIIDSTAFDVAYSSSNVLQELIGNILDISMIESEKLVIHYTEMELRKTIEQIISLFRPGAFNNGIELVLLYPAKLDDIIVTTDELRFRQVVSNIISNAIKFKNEGEVRVAVECVNSQVTDVALLQIAITDTGCGISPEGQQTLFRPFSQADINGYSHQSGSGLGLLISRRLCEALGGGIQLHSQPGVGTRVDITLKVGVSQQKSKRAAAEVIDIQRQNSSATVLVVDDFYPNLMLLNKQLSYLGYVVIECSDPRDAYAQWRSTGAEIIITDCNMPYISGIELTKLIRKENSDTVIIGLTADARDEQRGACLQAGMTECLFKPVSLKTLSLALSKFASAIQPATNACAKAEDRVDQHVFNSCLAHLDVTISDLHDAISAEDFLQIAELAHLMKGGFYLLKNDSLADLCTELEEAADRKTISFCLQLALRLEDAVSDLSS